ncbi:MAG: glycoside hydrolase family 127 protein, partial [Chloroflexi bacterium]
MRFGYLQAAGAALHRLSPDPTLMSTLETSWERMVTRRMYVTGGLGSLPALEGFGRDYELDPEFAYAETCAAIACLFWDWEMVLATGEARYSDLFEWQLFNAAAVGMGTSGKNYLYNNPLTCRGGVTRKPWFAVPCCPSNLSRTWASLGKYIFSLEQDSLWIHQYMGCQAEIDLNGQM